MGFLSAYICDWLKVICGNNVGSCLQRYLSPGSLWQDSAVKRLRDPGAHLVI
jgi:hypothetical protein